MKTSVITMLLSAFLLIGPLSSTAIASNGDETNKSRRTERVVRRAIDRAIIFPVNQEGKELQGTVDVSFQIDKSGKIKVVSVESSNTELMDYVLKKLKKIKLDNARSEEGQTIRYKFVFKQQI